MNIIYFKYYKNKKHILKLLWNKLLISRDLNIIYANII